MKKLLSFLLAFSLLLGMAALPGCGRSENEEVRQTLTRADWIYQLTQQYQISGGADEDPFFTDVGETNPYFPEVQACAKWGIVEASGEFRPADPATSRFAAVTAVKAMGVARLEKSDYKASLQSDEDIATFFEEQSGLSLEESGTLTATQAQEILDGAGDIADNMTLPQVHTVEYKENVRKLTLDEVAFSADGKTATLKSGTAAVGDFLVVEPSEYMPEGKYVKVTAADNNTLTYEQAALDELTDTFEISGTYEPEILAVRPLSGGITVESIGGETPVASPQGFYSRPKPSSLAAGAAPAAVPAADTYTDAGSVTLKVDQALSSGASISGTVKVNFDKITLDYGDWVWLPWDGYRDSYVRIDNTLHADLTVQGNYHDTMTLASVGMSFYGVLTVTADLVLNVGFDGEVSVAVEVNSTEEVTVPPWSGAKLRTKVNDSSVSAHLEVQGYIRPNLCAAVKVLGHKVTYVGAYTGLEAKAIADAEVTGDGAESCLDLKAWVPLVVYYGYDLIVTKGDEQKEFWNENNSVWKTHLHIEDGEVVEACTRTGEQVDPEVEDDPNAPVPPNIDEEGIDAAKNGGTDRMLISAFYVALNPGASDMLAVTRLPDGYSASDLVFTSSRPEIVTVDNAGILTAVGEGTAIIRVATSDGEYEQFCMVSAYTSFAVDFEPLV